MKWTMLPKVQENTRDRLGDAAKRLVIHPMANGRTPRSKPANSADDVAELPMRETPTAMTMDAATSTWAETTGGDSSLAALWCDCGESGNTKTEGGPTRPEQRAARRRDRNAARSDPGEHRGARRRSSWQGAERRHRQHTFKCGVEGLQRCREDDEHAAGWLPTRCRGGRYRWIEMLRVEALADVVVEAQLEAQTAVEAQAPGCTPRGRRTSTMCTIDSEPPRGRLL